MLHAKERARKVKKVRNKDPDKYFVTETRNYLKVATQCFASQKGFIFRGGYYFMAISRKSVLGRGRITLFFSRKKQPA